MPSNQFYTPPKSASQWTDTTNLGPRLPGGGQNGMMWDSDWQKAAAPPANSGNIAIRNMTTGGGNFGAFNGYNPNMGSASAQYGASTSAGNLGRPVGGATAGLNGAFDINSLVARQQADNEKADAINTERWNTASQRLLGVAGQYASDPNVRATNSLVGGLLANPESLNDGVVQNIQNQNQNNIQAQTDNQYRQLRGGLAAAGQSDSSTLEAMRERLMRSGLAQSQAATTNLGIERAKARTGDITNAANLGRTNSAANISVPLGINQSILSQLPQQKAPDYTGLGALAVAQQASKDRAAALSLQSQALGQNSGAGDPFQFTTPMGNKPIGANTPAHQRNEAQNGQGGFQVLQPGNGGVIQRAANPDWGGWDSEEEMWNAMYGKR